MIDQADYDWLSGIKNDYNFVKYECIPNCKSAIKNHQMQPLAQYGNNMFKACKHALNVMADTPVSSMMENTKKDCAEWFGYCAKAGASFSNGNVDDGINWMHHASNAITPEEVNEVEDSLTQIEGQRPQHL